MEISEMLWIASLAFAKGFNYHTLYYCDDMYGKEEFTEEVFGYLTEIKTIGKDAFYEKYKGYKLY